MSIILETKSIKKSFVSGQRTITILNGLNIEIRKGEMVAIMGVSGSGKSTLLHILGLLSEPDEGEIYFLDSKITYKNENKLAFIRNRYIGFVFQFYSLIGELNVVQNIMLPSMINNKPDKKKALELLELVGLGTEKKDKYPSTLSGGELQRVAIARALMVSPALVIADEPTANLDKAASIDIVKTMREINHSTNQTFIIATHSEDVANMCDRILFLSGGLLHEKN
ncbi:ABC transporter ATP-binding protein [Hippea maritima]|uniref:Phosphonate-transporting ATPase n=1 Tax=Hippea maritima (strain ATCC 700847 / DSM 10411 / MH2) TaxID=760142 RepID=F2LXD4_HIPMA|nr:ABC transporter ATP-binding protein [Hippea maritima]AEA34248.1 Phosphonate-transporting ATPase [Hippea maritima DSM 10411]